MKTSSTQEEQDYAKDLMETMIQKYPVRLTTTQAEKDAQDFIHHEFQKLGHTGQYESFRFNRSLYANLLLHASVALLGSCLGLWWPWLGLSVHALAWISYGADNTRLFYGLRRLFPFRPSQNLLVTVPATQRLRMRLVFLAHIDAAFTGWIFHPKMVKQATKPLPRGFRWLRFSIGVAYWSLVPLILLDILHIYTTWSLPWLLGLLSIPMFLQFSLNLQAVLHNHVVPGANDNLTGVIASVLLCSRLQSWKPDDVELVFVITGAEEASLGGAHALYRQHEQTWERKHTFVLGLDTLSGGELFYLKEGDIWPCPFPRWLQPVLNQTIQSDPRFHNVRDFRIPVGGTDVIPFLYGGYDAIAFGCVDLSYGAPRHYHRMTDTPENLDYTQWMLSVDFIEQFIYQLDAYLPPNQDLEY